MRLVSSFFDFFKIFKKTPTKLKVYSVPENEDDIRVDLILIHGLMGDTKKTWSNGPDFDYSWPMALCREVNGIRLWSLDYEIKPTYWFGRGMSLVERAVQVIELMRAKGIGKSKIIFIAHSFGGLLVKQILRNSKDKGNSCCIFEKTKQVIFLATPHSGSSLALYLAKSVPFSRPTLAIQDLLKDNPSLSDLNNWYKNNSFNSGIKTTVFYETIPTGIFGVVVNKDSSNPGITGVDPIPCDFDHLSISRFSNNDIEYDIIKDRLRVDCDLRDLAIVMDSTDDEIFIDISTYDERRTQDDIRKLSSGDSWIEYNVKKMTNELKIYYDFVYLNKICRQTEVEGVGCGVGLYDFTIPHLDFKILNNSPKTIFLTAINFEIVNGKNIIDPVVLFFDHYYFNSFCILNDGWSDAFDCVLKYNLKNDNLCNHYRGEYQFKSEIGLLKNNYVKDLSEDLIKIGVKIPLILDCGIIDPFFSFPKNIYIDGVFEYKYIGVGGGVEDKKIKFCSSVTVGPVVPTCALPPSIFYNARLTPNDEGKKVKCPVSQVVKSGDGDRFIIKVFTDQTSEYKINISFDINGKEVKCIQTTTLEVFMPKSMSNKVINTANEK